MSVASAIDHFEHSPSTACAEERHKQEGFFVALVDQDLLDLFMPLSDEERQQMRKRFRAHGCREPIISWKGQGILLHGLEELLACRELDIWPERIEEVELPDWCAARDWIIARHLERDLTPESASYFRGKRYAAVKHKPGGSRKRSSSSSHFENLNGTRSGSHFENLNDKGSSSHFENLKTEQRLAKAYCVSRSTIQRDYRFMRAVDTLVDNCGFDIKYLFLSHNALLTRKDAEHLAQLEPQEQRQRIAAARQTGQRPQWPKSGKDKRIQVPRELAAMAAALQRNLGEEETHALWQLLGIALAKASE